MQPIEVLASFGPVAFGTVVLIIIWKVVVKPELDARRVEMHGFNTMVQALEALHGQIKDSAVGSATNTAALHQLVEAQRVLLREMHSVINELREWQTQARDDNDPGHPRSPGESGRAP